MNWTICPKCKIGQLSFKETKCFVCGAKLGPIRYIFTKMVERINGENK